MEWNAAEPPESGKSPAAVCDLKAEASPQGQTAVCRCLVSEFTCDTIEEVLHERGHYEQFTSWVWVVF